MVLDLLLIIFTDPTFNVLLAGAAGGLVKWVRLKEQLFDGLISVLVGAVVAFFLAPVGTGLVESSLNLVIEMNEIEKVRLGGFIVGSTAMLIVGAVSELVVNTLNKQKDGKDGQNP